MDITSSFGFASGWLVPSLIVSGAVTVGLVAEWFLRSRLRAWAARSAWRGNQMILVAVRGLPTLTCVLIGLHVAAAQSPLDEAGRRVLQNVISVGLIGLVTVVTMRVAARLIGSHATALGIPGNASIYANIVRVGILALGLLVVFQHLGIPIAPMLTALGVGGLAVALALQPTLSNLFSGIQILATKKIQPGHLIRLDSGEEGTVVDISWRETAIRTPPGNLVLVPNASVASAVVTNYSLPTEDLAAVVELGVAYDSDLEQVERITHEIARAVQAAHPSAVPDFPVAVLFTRLDPSSIALIAVMRAKSFLAAIELKHEFIKRILPAYTAAGIAIPFPTQTVLLSRSVQADLSREPGGKPA